MKVSFILFLFLSVFSQVSSGSSIEYQLKPVPKTDRTDLVISVQFRAENEQVIKLPQDCYGTPNLHRFVVQFFGRNGTTVKTAENERERIVKPNEKGEVSLGYVLSFDPQMLENSAFAPKIHSEFFSLAGCQWLLRLPDDEKKIDYSIEIIDAPKDWNLHSSIRQNPGKIKINASYDDLISTRIGGGGSTRTFYIRRKPVSVFIKGDFEIPDKEIFETVEKIVRSQRDWFEDYEQPFYQVVINERKGVVAGTSIENQFVCFIQTDVDKVRLNMILAHEMFHNWLPVKMGLKLAEGDHQIRHEWFFEGFTEYFAKKVLFDAGLLSPEKFAELINKDIHNLADNPYKSINYKDFLAVANARQFSSGHKKLSYYRGVLIALRWEAKLRRAGKNLSGFIRRLYKITSQKGGKISEQEFFEYAENYGIDAAGDFEKYILAGDPIEIDPNALGENFTAMEKEVPLFDAGFSVSGSGERKEISEVAENSPAYRAGLRNGMEFVRAENSSRFSNAWESEKPLTVAVKIDGKEKEFTYFPHGGMIKLLQFQVTK